MRGRPHKDILFENLSVKAQEEADEFEDYLLDAELVYKRSSKTTQRWMRERVQRWLEELIE